MPEDAVDEGDFEGEVAVGGVLELVVDLGEAAGAGGQLLEVEAGGEGAGAVVGVGGGGGPLVEEDPEVSDELAVELAGVLAGLDHLPLAGWPAACLNQLEQLAGPGQPGPALLSFVLAGAGLPLVLLRQLRRPAVHWRLGPRAEAAGS